MIEKYKLLIGLVVFHIIYFSLGYLVNPYLSTGISLSALPAFSLWRDMRV